MSQSNEENALPNATVPARMISSNRREFGRRVTQGLTYVAGVGVMGRWLAELASANDEPARQATDSHATKVQTDDIDYLSIPEAEWKRRLTPEQFRVARKHGTERAFSKNNFYDNKKDGVYYCVCCKSPLFDSNEKFDSGTGWPSYWQPKDVDLVGESVDNLLGYPRTEVHCKKCAAHLGHVFDDAPKTPTGLRYCINGVCLIFVPRNEVEAFEESKLANNVKKERN